MVLILTTKELENLSKAIQKHIKQISTSKFHTIEIVQKINSDEVEILIK